jgi:hypothetical protein
LKKITYSIVFATVFLLFSNFNNSKLICLNQISVSIKNVGILNDECNFPLKYLDGSFYFAPIYDVRNNVIGLNYGTKTKNLSTKTSYMNLRYKIDFVNNKLDTIYTLDFVVDGIIEPGETNEFKSEKPFNITPAQYKAKYHQYIKIVSAECVK